MAPFFNFNHDAEFHAEINHLIELGWEFDFQWDKNDPKHHIIIRYYTGTDKFTMQIVNSQKLVNGIFEGSDEENAGDSSMIKEDLISLFDQGKLFNIDLEIDWL